MRPVQEGRHTDADQDVFNQVQRKEAGMINWIDDACNHWAFQVRFRDFGGQRIPAEQFQTYDYQHNPEGLTEDAAKVSSAIFLMRTRPELKDAHNALMAHYMVDVAEKVKPSMVNAGNTLYWRLIHEAHCYLVGKLDALRMSA